MGQITSVMTPQLGFWPQMCRLNRTIYHFGPMLSRLKSGVGLSALVLVLFGMGWALFGLNWAPSCLIWAHLISRWPASELKRTLVWAPRSWTFMLLNLDPSNNSGLISGKEYLVLVGGSLGPLRPLPPAHLGPAHLGRCDLTVEVSDSRGQRQMAPWLHR